MTIFLMSRNRITARVLDTLLSRFSFDLPGVGGVFVRSRGVSIHRPRSDMVGCSVMQAEGRWIEQHDIGFEKEKIGHG
jgi:hypothetical protein